MQHKTNIELLVFKYLQGILSEEERLELEEWRGQEGHEELFDKLTDRNRIGRKMERLEEYDWEKSWKQVRGKLHKNRSLDWRYWGMAASFVGFFLMGVWMFWGRTIEDETAEVLQVVEPGRVFAELTLPEGKMITLNKDTCQVVLKTDGNALDNRNGVLSLQQNSAQDSQKGYYEVKTPKGGEYQVVLPDGSVVWLNADSKLRCPVAFTGRERRVEVSGELYFKVVRNEERPFRVKIEGGYEVEVLGTEFNVRAYDDVPSATTLVNGSVVVRNKGQQVRLQPGEQAVGVVGRKLEVQKVDVEPYIAWKKGYFQFENQRLEDILNELARWYNVNVFFENSSVREKRFSVDMKRHERFEEALRLIGQTKAVRIEINGNNVFVK